MIPFAKTADERRVNNDPRPSLQERYATHDGYVAAVKKAAERSVAEGFLLPEDVAALIAAFTKNADVESCNLGVTTGDFQAFTLVLKSAKDKQWFINAFKKAGLMTMKINNKPVVNTENI